MDEMAGRAPPVKMVEPLWAWEKRGLLCTLEKMQCNFASFASLKHQFLRLQMKVYICCCLFKLYILCPEMKSCRQEVAAPADNSSIWLSVCCTASLCISDSLVVRVCYQWWFLRGRRQGFVLPRSDVTESSAESLSQFLQPWKCLLCPAQTQHRASERISRARD